MAKINGRKIFGIVLIGFGLVVLWVSISKIDTLSTFGSYGGADITFAGYLNVIFTWVGYFLIPIFLLFVGYRQLKKAK